jgi:thiosulfate dehydrogenase
MNKNEDKELYGAVIRLSNHVVWIALFTVLMMVITITILLQQPREKELGAEKNSYPITDSGPRNSTETSMTKVSKGIIPPFGWKSPDPNTIPKGKEGDMIRYGKALITSTALYFGPQGSIARLSNGMNCQNCHLDAGTRLFSNNFSAFVASYPKKSARSGRVEEVSERIAECFQRSLNGGIPDPGSKEVKAMLAYMTWVGKGVKKGQKVYGLSTQKLAFMDHAASPVLGKAVFVKKCQVCHGPNGEGKLNPDKKSYLYPPLWGAHSYNDGAGMYRLSNFAGFVKNNMPYGTTYQNPQLTDEEAWNVAAFVNSQPRPHRDHRTDYPNLKQKPIDSPFGPYADHFSEQQHKYGPFKPILKNYKI